MKNRQLNIRVSGRLMGRMERVAGTKGLDVSELVRTAVDKYLTEEEKGMDRFMLKETDKLAIGYDCVRVFTEKDVAEYIAEGYTEVTREEALEKVKTWDNIGSKYLGFTTNNI